MSGGAANLEETEGRIARNEVVRRQVNEAIEKGSWRREGGGPLAFRCECGRLGCSETIRLTVSEYERVRRYPRRFFVTPEHVDTTVEVPVEERRDYVVVEKVDRAGRVAEASDPRR